MFKEILVALDDSEQATAALELAIQLGTALRSSLNLVHVIDSGQLVLTAADPAGASALTIELDELQAAGKGLLEDAAARVRSAGLSVTTSLREGVPAASIIDAAQRSGCDLIVLGTHGRHGVARLFLGSTAETVLRESPIPVLLKRG